MSQKRYCDSCDELLLDEEEYYQLVLNVMIKNKVKTTWLGDNCKECAKSGEGLVKIMEAYENSTN